MPRNPRPDEGYPEPIIEPGSELDPFRPATEEEIAAAVKYRDGLIQMSNAGARMSSLEAELIHAYRMEEHHRSVIAQGFTLEPEVIAYALIKQGKYDEALQHPSKHDAEARALILARMERDDKRCGCDPVSYQETIGNRTSNKTTCPENVVAQPWLADKLKFGWLFRCGICNFQNLVEHLPGEIADAHIERMASMAQHEKWRP